MITILLSTYNGARFLPEQLASFERQTNPHWCIVWRDDGSTDDTVSIMEEFSIRTKRCTLVKDPKTRLGPTGSFFLLLKEAEKHIRSGDIILFSDQDDIWMPEKIQRAYEFLFFNNERLPAIYFARQRLIDEYNNIIGDSPNIKFLPSFPDCLAQNVAAGCTIALNKKAVILVNKITPPTKTFHDWWCYIIVAACGGLCIYDDRPVIYYRQHQNNTIGAPKNYIVRAAGAFRRGPRGFMTIFRDQINTLSRNSSILTDHSKNIVKSMNKLMHVKYKLLLFMVGVKLKRQHISETILFYVWVLFG